MDSRRLSQMFILVGAVVASAAAGRAEAQSASGRMAIGATVIGCQWASTAPTSTTTARPRSPQSTLAVSTVCAGTAPTQILTDEGTDRAPERHSPQASATSGGRAADAGEPVSYVTFVY